MKPLTPKTNQHNPPNPPANPTNPESFTTSLKIISTANTSGRRTFRGVLTSAGRDRTLNNEPGKRIITRAALEDGLSRGLFNNLAMFIDHPGFWDGPSIRNLAALVTETTLEGDYLNATFTTYDTEPGRIIADLLTQTLEDDKKPDIGISLNLYPEIVEYSEKTGERTFKKFRSITSADFVFKPALKDARVLQKLQSQKGENMDDETNPVPQEEKLSPTGTPIGNNGNPADAWRNLQRDTVITTVLNAATDLPDQVKQKLLKAHAKHPYETPEQLEDAIKDERATLAAIRKDTVQLGGLPPRGNGHIALLSNEQDKMQAAVDWMFGVQKAQTPDWQLRDPAFLYRALTGDVGFHGVFDPDRVLFGGADTTTLANMAVNAMNKVIIEQWSALTYYRWYELITKVEPNDGSVQDMQWISFGGIGDLPVVDEKASYNELDVDDAKESDSFKKYGGYVGITLEMFRNSQIQQMQAVPRALANAAVRTRSSKIAAIFTVNSGVGPTLDQDSVALFHAVSHVNLLTTALGTDTAAWIAVANAIFKHTEINSGKRLGIFPRFCLVPVDLYFQALANFGYGQGNPTTFNPFTQDANGRLHTTEDPRPVPLVVPEWTDATDWAAITDPMLHPVIHMSYAQNPGGGSHPAPETFVSGEARAGLLFTNDTMPIKIRDWFAYGVSTYRGIHKNNV